MANSLRLPTYYKQPGISWKKKLHWVLHKESLVLTFNIVAQMKTNDFVRIFFQLVYNCIVSITFFNSPAHLVISKTEWTHHTSYNAVMRMLHGIVRAMSLLWLTRVPPLNNVEAILAGLFHNCVRAFSWGYSPKGLWQAKPSHEIIRVKRLSSHRRP